MIQDYIEHPWQHPDTYSAFHLYIIRVKSNNKFTRNLLFEKFRNAGVLVNIHYIPVYMHPYYQKIGFDEMDFPNAQQYYTEAISIPIFSTLTEAQQEFVIEVVNKPAGFQNLF